MDRLRQCDQTGAMRFFRGVRQSAPTWSHWCPTVAAIRVEKGSERTSNQDWIKTDGPREQCDQMGAYFLLKGKNEVVNIWSHRSGVPWNSSQLILVHCI